MRVRGAAQRNDSVPKTDSGCPRALCAAATTTPRAPGLRRTGLPTPLRGHVPPGCPPPPRQATPLCGSLPPVGACPSWRRSAKDQHFGDLFSRPTNIATKNIVVEIYGNKATKGRNPSLFHQRPILRLRAFPQPPGDLKQGGRSHQRVTWAFPGIHSRPPPHSQHPSQGSCPTLCDPTDCSPPGSLSMGFSRQERWSGLPCPPPGNLPDPGIEPVSSASPALVGRFFTTAPPGKPRNIPAHKYYSNK